MISNRIEARRSAVVQLLILRRRVAHMAFHSALLSFLVCHAVDIDVHACRTRGLRECVFALVVCYIFKRLQGQRVLYRYHARPGGFLLTTSGDQHAFIGWQCAFLESVVLVSVVDRADRGSGAACRLHELEKGWIWWGRLFIAGRCWLAWCV